MKDPETVLRDLGDLYEFYRRIKQFTIKERKSSNKQITSISSTRAVRTTDKSS